MAFPAWAYDVSNFIQPPEEEFICSICKGVFCDPMQSPCNHVFCKNCIILWLEKKKNCPICRQGIEVSDLKNVMPLFQNLILKLKLRCSNAERGCKKIITQEDCLAHLRSCPYELVQCSNSPCTVILQRRMIENHEKRKCLHGKYPCEKCGLVILPDHDCITDLKSCVQDLKTKLRERNKVIKKYIVPNGCKFLLVAHPKLERIVHDNICRMIAEDET